MAIVVQAERKGNDLYITVQGPTIDDVNNNAARMLAYEARFDHGFENAGISAFGGPYAVDLRNVDETSKVAQIVEWADRHTIGQRPADLAYQHTFRLTRGL